MSIPSVDTDGIGFTLVYSPHPLAHTHTRILTPFLDYTSHVPWLAVVLASASLLKLAHLDDEGAALDGVDQDVARREVGVV